VKRNFILLTLIITALLVVAQISAQAQTQKQNQQSQSSPEGGQKTADDQKDVNQKIQELQKQVDILKEQGRTREKLSQTAEEKAEQEKAILSAVGREYTLMPKGQFEVEYSLRYEYISSSTIVSATVVEARANHTIRNTIGVQYGILNNLTVNMSLPFVYAYDKTGTSTARDVSDMGDVTLGLDFQPFKSSGAWPTTTFTLGAILPTGRSPYKIDRDNDLPTGSGLYGFTLGVNMSKAIDPAMLFGALSATYRVPRNDLEQYMNGLILERVDPGMSFNGAIGLAYSISYALSMNTQFQYGYNMGTKYGFTNGSEVNSPAYSTASIVLGAGWRFSPKTTVSFSVGIGLTKDDPDFFFLFRLPFSF